MDMKTWNLIRDQIRDRPGSWDGDEKDMGPVEIAMAVDLAVRHYEELKRKETER
jgi:hypothetical protein